MEKVKIYIADCGGIPVISTIPPKSLNMSSLRGTKDAKFVSSSDKLVKALNSIKTNQQNNFDSERYYWLDHKLPMWKNLLN